MRILATRLCVYVCVVVGVMYTCKTGNFDKETLCLCLGFCRGYVLGHSLVSVVGILLGFNKVTELSFWDGKVIFGKTRGAMVGI